MPNICEQTAASRTNPTTIETDDRKSKRQRFRADRHRG